MEAAGAADAAKPHPEGKRRRKRTEAEKEERRRRKEAEAAAAAAGANGASTPQDGTQVLQVGSRPTSAVSIASEDVSHHRAPPPGRGSPSAAWGGNSAAHDLERGEGGGGGGGSGGTGGAGASPFAAPDGGDPPRFIPPSYAVALKHAKAVNVYRQRAGITVRMHHDALVGLSGDEILADIYGDCEKRGILIQRVVKAGKASAAIEDVPTSQAADLVGPSRLPAVLVK